MTKHDSPLNNSFSEREDPIGGRTNNSQHNPKNIRFNVKSYADTVRTQQRDGFTLDTDMQANDNKITPGGRLFLEAMEENSIVISFSGMNFKEKSLNVTLREHFPNGLGLRVRHVGKKFQYIEISFETSAEREAALHKKLIIFYKMIRIDRTLDEDASVIRVCISNTKAKFIYPRLANV